MKDLIPRSEVFEALRSCKRKNVTNDDYDISVVEAIDLITQIVEVKTVHTIMIFDRMLGKDYKIAFVEPEIVRCKSCKYCKDCSNDDVSYDYVCENKKSCVVATDADFGCVLGEENDD